MTRRAKNISAGSDGGRQKAKEDICNLLYCLLRAEQAYRRAASSNPRGSLFPAEGKNLWHHRFSVPCAQTSTNFHRGHLHWSRCQSAAQANNGLLTLPFGFRREHGTMQRAGFLRLRAVSKIFQIRIGTAVFACAKVAVFAYGDRDDGVRLRKCSN